MLVSLKLPRNFMYKFRHEGVRAVIGAGVDGLGRSQLCERGVEARCSTEHVDVPGQDLTRLM